MKKLKLIVISALFAALITVMTAYIFHIPIGSGGGYFHLGDTLIYFAAALLPKPYAIAAAVIGAATADLLTAPIWVFATIIIKSAICLSFNSKNFKLICGKNIFAVLIGIGITSTGYYLAEALMFSNWISPLYSVLGNILQSLLSGLLFIVIGAFLDKKDLKKRFTV